MSHRCVGVSSEGSIWRATINATPKRAAEKATTLAALRANAHTPVRYGCTVCGYLPDKLEFNRADKIRRFTTPEFFVKAAIRFLISRRLELSP